MGVKGAKSPSVRWGMDGPLQKIFNSQKEISVPPNLEKEGLSPWNVGETPGDEKASAMRDGIPAVFQA